MIQFQDKDAPESYNWARSNVGGDRRYLIENEASAAARVNEGLSKIGILISTGALVVNTCGEVGYVLPSVAGFAAFGVLHVLFDEATKYADRCTDLSYEIQLNQHVDGKYELDAEGQGYLSERIKDAKGRRRKESLKYFMGTAFLTAALTVGSSSSVVRDGAERLHDFFDANALAQVAVEPDTAPRPVLASEHAFLTREM